MDALLLARRDMETFVRLYAFLGQIFDYGNTALEKRFLFFRHLVRLLRFERERTEVDLSQIVLTHHAVRSLGKRHLDLKPGDAEPLSPLTEPGTGVVQEREKAELREIIARINQLFGTEISDQDQVTFVMDVVRGKVLQSEELQRQAGANSEAQFRNSPTLDSELLDAIMDAMEVHQAMSRKAIADPQVRAGLKEILLGPGRLYRELRKRLGGTKVTAAEIGADQPPAHA